MRPLGRRRWADYEFTAIAVPFPTSTIPPPGAYPAPNYIHIPGRGTALVSAPIDQALATVGIQARLADQPCYAGCYEQVVGAGCPANRADSQAIARGRPAVSPAM
jgi:hypothetical protein